MAVLYTTIIVSLFCTSFAAPQQPELDDQSQITETPEPAVSSDQPSQPEQQTQPKQQLQLDQQVQPKAVAETGPKTVQNTVIVPRVKKNKTQASLPQVGFTLRVYKLISEPIFKVIRAPKVNEVLSNIGTCVVNGAMELFSYYLPAPFMPLLATAAGLVIPFEPVVMLKERMPVTSYRRAFQTAMSSFLRTFDKYKVDDDYDPYMARRFNRRFMNNKNDDGTTLEPGD